MAEAVADRRWSHIRGVTVTTVASVAGILAGIVAGYIATAPDDALGVAVFAIAVFLQFPLLRLVGIEVEDFGIKDYLFVGFMTFAFWFITWTILLTTEASIPI